MRLKEDFFDTEELLLLENQPDGEKYSNILLKLYLKSLKNEATRCCCRKSITFIPGA